MGSPCADGNALVFDLPPTEWVGNMREVEDILLRRCLQPPRTWREVFEEMCELEYAHRSAREKERIVEVSLKRQRAGYLPIVIIERYQSEVAFHKTHLLK